MDLIEARPDWNATTGSGITLQGNALRVLRELGVWERVEASGYAFGSLGVTTPDGTVLFVAEDIRTGGEDLPATLGMQRPRLQQILIDAVRASGAVIPPGHHRRDPGPGRRTASPYASATARPAATTW
ncbi:hypothetical protein ACRAWF_20225 [Streptomyces sp. L7]